MSKLQNSKNILPFIDYIPAELKENKIWTIVYYVINPYQSNTHRKLQRIRHRVKYLKCKRTRRIYAQGIVLKINQKLMRGWTPFERVNSVSIACQKQLKTPKLLEVFDNYLKQMQQQAQKDALRPDTLRAYTSYINNLKAFLKEKKQQHCDISHFDEKFCREFLDMIFYTLFLS